MKIKFHSFINPILNVYSPVTTSFDKKNQSINNYQNRNTLIRKSLYMASQFTKGFHVWIITIIKKRVKLVKIYAFFFFKD